MSKYLLVVLIVSCLGGTTRNSESSRAFMIVRHDTNQVEMCISNYGKFGQGESGVGSGCWWPKGSNHTYIYGAGIWFGTVDSLTGDTLVTIGYGPHGGEGEFGPGLSSWPVAHPAAIIYIHPENWPAPPDTLPMAPQELISHEDSWCCFNDSDSVYHIVGDTRPIGIEVYQTVYAWDYWFVEDIIFFTYDVKNVSGHTLFDCYFGVCTDCDIGNEAGSAANDRTSGVVGQWYVIDGDSIWVDDVGYQWQEQEEPGAPPWWAGSIGFDLLQTPFDLVPGNDKDNDGIPDQYERDSAYYVNNLPVSQWDVDYDGLPDWRDASENPQFGMTAMKRFTLQVEPNIDAERYATLAGYNFVTGLYEPFDTVPPDPDDQRFLLSSGPFNLAPDSIATLVFGVMFANWHNIHLTPDTGMALVDKWAQHFYDQYWFIHTGIHENFKFRIANCEMKIVPNPMSGTGTVSFSLSAASHVSLKLYNIAGQMVRKFENRYLEAGTYSVSIDIYDLPLGTYFLVMESPDSRTSHSLVIIR
ncbi:MAG: T9SS type A sorting domain-containing protein [bacterium]